MSNEWLQKLKKGDKVLLDKELMLVVRTTKTQIILSNGARFRKAEGREVGGYSGVWGRRRYIREYTEEAWQEILCERISRAKRRLKQELSAIGYKVDDQKIDTVYKVLTEEHR